MTAVNPPRNGERPFALLDVAGGTGDIAFRVADAGNQATRITVADINHAMLEVGRARAADRGLDDVVTFVEGNAETLPFPDRAFDAVTIAFGIRNVPRIDRALAEAQRVLRIGGHFLCLEFSAVDVPGLDTVYDAYSFNVIPAIGRAVTGDAEAYRYLVEFDPPLSAPGSVRRHDAHGGPRPRVVPAPERRHRRAAFGLAAVTRDISPLVPCRPPRPRRIRVRARGRAGADRSEAVAAVRAHGAARSRAWSSGAAPAPPARGCRRR